ncbi:hypothetical protein BC835DRAFT_1418034 [Cytidiella melzeri]|nr:hypothetical protein BC835DRAFT_1418034 [Cytidiella melzeri]
MSAPPHEVKEKPAKVLPGYTSSAREPVTHSYSLTHKDGHVWIKLNLRSNAVSAAQLPIIVEGQTIRGTVEIDPKEDPKSITIQIRGELVSEGNIRFSFVDVSQELWPVPRGDEDSALKDGADYQSLPYGLDLPSTVELPAEDRTLRSFRLPANDYARYRRYDIIYRVTVTVKHRSLFRPDHILETLVNYLPLVIPPPPSLLRKRAYEAQAPIPAPDADPEGWHSLPSATFSGKIFGHRTASIVYTLSLAKPLSYTRGSVIPLHLLVEADDEQALDLLSAPLAPVVHARRISSVNYDAGGGNVAGVCEKLSDLKQMPMMAFQELVDYINKATWWSTPCEKSGARTLQGEIHIRGSSKPSAHLGLYKLTYDVALFEPEISGFAPDNAHKAKAVQTVEVEVATAYAPGARPISYSPPTYYDETESQTSQGNGTRFNAFNPDVLAYSR